MNHLHSLMLITHFEEKVDYSHPIAVVKEQHTIGIGYQHKLAINVRWTVRYEMFWRIRSRELPDSTIHCEGQVVKNYTIHTCLTTQLCKFVLVSCYLVNTCTTRHKSA